MASRIPRSGAASMAQSTKAPARPASGGAIRRRAAGQLAGPRDGRDEGGGGAGAFGGDRPHGRESRPERAPVASRGRAGTYGDRGLGYRPFTQRRRELAP